MIFVHGLDGQEVCHSLRSYSMFLECNNIRARLRPNEFSGRSPHSFTVASFDRSFHTTCRVSICEYHQCCGFGWAASISFVEIPAMTLRYWQCSRCCIKLTIYRLWKVLCRFWEILGNAFYVDSDRHYPCKSRLFARLWRPASLDVLWHMHARSRFMTAALCPSVLVQPGAAPPTQSVKDVQCTNLLQRVIPPPKMQYHLYRWQQGHKSKQLSSDTWMVSLRLQAAPWHMRKFQMKFRWKK